MSQETVDIVKALMEIAKEQEIYDWLKGLESPGPLPRNAPYYRFLYLLADRFKFQKMVDLGTCEGVSSMCMARGNPAASVYTIDREYKLQIYNDRCRMDNVVYFIGDALDDSRWSPDGVGLLFIDILHTPESMQKAFEMYERWVISGGVIVLDGVNWKGASDKMPEWWEGFNPAGYTKITDIGLHTFQDAGSGVLVKD